MNAELYKRIKSELGEEYDDPTDEYEIVLRLEEYEEAAEKLLNLINKREETVGLLKIAAPDRIADVRQGIVLYEKTIASCEEYAASRFEVYRLAIDLWRKTLELQKMTDIIEPALLKHVAENNPEKLEAVKEMLADDSGGKTH